MTTCNSCGATIEWRQTPAGKRIPIDPEPVVGGNLELVGRSIAKAVGKGEGTHVSHFATCPNTSQHRRRTPVKNLDGRGGERPVAYEAES